MEGELRRLPKWQNLTQEAERPLAASLLVASGLDSNASGARAVQDILPTASAAPDDETLKKRYADAVLLGVAIIGRALTMATLGPKATSELIELSLGQRKGLLVAALAACPLKSRSTPVNEGGDCKTGSCAS